MTSPTPQPLLAHSRLLDARDPSRAPRVALFRAPDFPTVDAPEIPDAILDEALADLPVHTLGLSELNVELRLSVHDVLVLPYGSAFPLDAWMPIRDFVQRGGGLVVLGGAPFHQPVRRVGDGWEFGVRQPTFAHDFLIGPADVWTRGESHESLEVSESEWSEDFSHARTVHELVIRLAKRKDLEDEHGAEGHRDAILRPLVQLVAEPHGLPVACPLFEIDRLRGSEAGGRWVLTTSDASLTSTTIRRMVERALEGAVELDARPVHASIQPGEIAVVRVVQRRPFVREGEYVPSRAEITVRNEAGEEIFYDTVELVGPPESRHGVATIEPPESWEPGLYPVEVTTPDAPWHPRSTATAFWVWDEALMTSPPPVTVSRDWLRRGGEVLPVIGTTYMASDVHRKFLFEPNPAVWDRDFELMARLGINFIRTGLWTAWDRAMLNSGAIDEGFLRALDAYILSAARHGLVVNYTFFAFLPPAFGSENPYLDPRAIEGQRELLTMVVQRYRGVHWVHWDLINEPSYSTPEGLWSTEPTGGEAERSAWLRWVLARHGDDEARLRDRWQDPSPRILDLPDSEELRYTAIRDQHRPRKARDFVLFSQDAVTGWARTLREILRTAGGDVLVTLGQDEGGTETRSSQQLHAEAVDYTAMHPWWHNDDLLASGVMAKVPEKPSLFQETGLMRLEDLDGWSWRSPELAAQVLERKFALAFGSRNAGAIQWAWNINPYQTIDNESVIGFFRPDGTAKPELDVIPDFAAFFEKAAPYLDDFEPDEVIAVIPHSRLFMSRPGGVDGFERIVRVLSERFGVVPTGLSELRLTTERLADAKLIIVPSPLVLEDSAAEALAAAARAGTKVLFTGVVQGNPYGTISLALEELGIVDSGRPVKWREATAWGADDGTTWATFDRDWRETLRRSESPSLESLDGHIWHEPLPLEFAREEEPLAALLSAALDAAGVETQPCDSGVVARLLTAPRAVLAVVVNETASDARRRLKVEGGTVVVPVAANRSRLVLFERGTGRVLAYNAGEAPTLVE